jgi:hypothetical protein
MPPFAAWVVVRGVETQKAVSGGTSHTLPKYLLTTHERFMKTDIQSQAFASEEKVQEIAKAIVRVSDAIHHSLRRMSPNVISNSQITSYALLTEEYALRARANILLIDARRFIIPDFDFPQDELVDFLSKLELKFDEIVDLDELSELLVGMMLFANSIVSRKNSVIFFLLENLRSLL